VTEPPGKVLRLFCKVVTAGEIFCVISFWTVITSRLKRGVALAMAMVVKAKYKMFFIAVATDLSGGTDECSIPRRVAD
jgi:hypothetical protein